MLRDNPLSVPLYQRSYSWKREQVEAFWGDLRASLVLPDPEYFLGTIVLTHDGPRRAIIDGQQRLATTALLIAAIRDAFLNANDTDRANVLEREYLASRSLRSGDLEPRLHLNQEDDDRFSAVLLGLPWIAGSDPTPESHDRLEAAAEFLRRQVMADVEAAGPNWATRLFEWTEFLETSARVIVVDVPNDSDAFLIFETLNDRGLDLTIADLLKNYLFGLSRDSIADIQHAWISATTSLRQVAEEEAFTQFIRHYWSSLHGATRERELYRNLKKRVRTRNQAVDLVSSLDRAAPNYAALLDPAAKRWSELGIGQALAATLLRFGLEQNRPLLLAAMDQFKIAELRKLMRAMISWAVRGLIVGGAGGGTYERYLTQAAVAIRQGSLTTALQVFNQIQTIVPSDEEFVDSFASKRVNQTRLARYYLMAYENYDAGLKDPGVIGSEDEAGVALELILPRRPELAEWAEFPEDSLGIWALRLGNQVLVPQGEAVDANASWSAKRKVLAKAGRALAEDASNYKLWTPTTVEEIQREIASVAPEIWPRRP